MTKRFDPKEDITAFELALIFGNIVTGPGGKPPLKAEIEFDDATWAELPANIKRHFR